MLGAIIGDIAGSRFEFNNTKSKDFELLDKKCHFTDDTVMTVAVADALMSSKGLSELKKNTVKCMQKHGRPYPGCGYGSMFFRWMYTENPKPYNSFGNGAAMRISPVGFWAKTEKEVESLSETVTAVTHNHPEGIIGAKAIALSVFWALQGKDKEYIFNSIARDFYPELLTKTLAYERLHEEYGWNYGLGSVTCQSSVPQAIVCFHESKSFEDAIRLAVALGGDSDTIAAMAGGIAEAYYGIPPEIEKAAIKFLPQEFIDIITQFREAVKERLKR